MRVTTTQEASDLKSISVESPISNQQEKEGGSVLIRLLLLYKPYYKAVNVVLLSVSLCFLTNSCLEDYQPIDMMPIYKDRIKDIDPLDGLMDGMSDYVTF
jgi:hypothetical protein